MALVASSSGGGGGGWFPGCGLLRFDQGSCCDELFSLPFSTFLPSIIEQVRAIYGILEEIGLFDSLQLAAFVASVFFFWPNQEHWIFIRMEAVGEGFVRRGPGGGVPVVRGGLGHPPDLRRRVCPPL